MSALRILHVVPYYEHAWAYGGIPRLATAMTRGLAARGHAITVCTTDACDATSRLSAADEPAFVAGLRVLVFPNVSNRLAYHWQLFAPLGLRTHLRASAEQYDVAHLHACRNLPGLLAARILRRRGIPYVISPNGTAPAIERRILVKQVFDRVAGARLLSHAERILAATQAEMRQLVQLGIPAARIRVIPNPVHEPHRPSGPDTAGFRHAHGLSDGPVVLFLGKLTPRKGVDVLVKAFATLGRPETTLVVAGNDMGAGRSIDALTRTLGLGARVRRVGLLKGLERLDALAAASVVVYPSRDEVFGLVAAESLLCGSPVVVCDDNGCGEIVRQVGGGLCVPYGDAARLATAIAAVLDSNQAWRARARTAGALVRERFGAQPVCEQLEALYRDVLRERRGAA